MQLVIENEPNPIVVSMLPDGSLAGPGSVLVKGRIIIGYTTTNQVMVDGASAAAQGYSCNGPCTSSSSLPNFAPKI